MTQQGFTMERGTVEMPNGATQVGTSWTEQIAYIWRGVTSARTRAAGSDSMILGHAQTVDNGN